MNDTQYVATFATALGSGLIAGVFFTFSTFVMAALKKLPPAQGIAAMQSINVLAVTAAFMTLLFGTALASLGVGIAAVLGATDLPIELLVAGAAFYLIGTIGVTIAGNVPLNNRLAELDPNAAGSVSVWDDYVARWTRLNHVRTVTALAAAALLTTAITL